MAGKTKAVAGKKNQEQWGQGAVEAGLADDAVCIGVVGVFAQIGFIGATLATLFVVRPKLVTYLRNSQMNSGEWICLAGTGFIGYRLGYNFANTFFGDAEKVNNHWTAYFYQKQLNRFEGRQILSKRPGNY